MALETAIYSPQMLWKDFDSSLPLKDEIVSDEVYAGITYRNVYFSGREVSAGSRVRIFATHAFAKNPAKKTAVSALLILPDFTETIDGKIIEKFAALGYTVLMVDYRGATVDNHGEECTVYPNSVDYANYEKSGRYLDYADTTARETCWYEWVAVAKYALSYLKQRTEASRIGVLGIKNGANIGWMLAGTDDRVDCFAAMFGAGWRAYRACYKNSGKDIEKNEERLRFLAGVESQAYAQGVKCPTLFVAPTNSSEFDVDRSADTLMRVPAADGSEIAVERFNNYAPRLNDVVDGACRRDVELFFNKFLQCGKTAFPAEPKLKISCDGRSAHFVVSLDVSDVKKPKAVKLFVSEGFENPALRDWNEAVESRKKTEDERSFFYEIKTNVSFITAFALVEYRNGVTLSSKMISKKTEMQPRRDNKLVFCSQRDGGVGSFTVYNVKNHADCGLFFEDDNAAFSAEGPDGISGVSSKYGLISYKLNNKFVNINERSLAKLDVYAESFAALTITLMVDNGDGTTLDYAARVPVKGAPVWQNLIVKCTDFKSELGRTIREFDKIAAIRFESEQSVVINNFLLI